MGYTVSYSKKNPIPDEPAFNRKDGFTSRENAERWISTNQSIIYWSQIVNDEPKSELPRVVLTNATELSDDTKWTKKVGTLETFFETGMECLGLMLSEDGVHGAPNPDFDPDQPVSASNFEYFGTYDAINPIQNGQILEINGTYVGMIYDREFSIEDGHRLSFYPRGYTRKELMELFQPGTVKATLYLPK